MSDIVLNITRLLDAPPERVFGAWMERAQWASWIGPAGVRCDVPVHEPWVGGRYRLVMHLERGDMAVVGVFKIVERPNRIAFTWMMEGGTHDSLVTIDLAAAAGGRTALSLRHDGLLTADNRDQHGRGWESTLGKLEAFLGEG
jgi:uncharacterized protein YndB with AHSA1/START domain